MILGESARRGPRPGRAVAHRGTARPVRRNALCGQPRRHARYQFLAVGLLDRPECRTSREVEELIEAINRQVLDTVGSVGQYTQSLLDSAETMSTVSVSVDDNANIAASASGSTLQSAQTVAAAAEQLHASIGEISKQVSRSATTAQSAVSRMAETRKRGRSARQGGRRNRPGGEADRRHRRADQPAGAQRHHRGGPRRRGRPGLCGRGPGGESARYPSGKSAEEISERIGRIQEVVRHTAASIEDVSTTIGTFGEISGSIAAAVEQQTAATSEIAKTINATADQASQVSALMGMVSERVKDAREASDSVKRRQPQPGRRLEQARPAADAVGAHLLRYRGAPAFPPPLAAGRRRRDDRRRREKVRVFDIAEYGALVASEFRMAGEIAGFRSRSRRRTSASRARSSVAARALPYQVRPAACGRCRRPARAEISRATDRTHQIGSPRLRCQGR